MSQKRLDPFAALFRIVRQYRVKYRQGRTVEARQRQIRIPGERSGQAASKHSPGETIQGRGKQRTIRESGNSPRSNEKSNTGITLRNDSRAIKTSQRVRVCEWFICVCVNEVQVWMINQSQA